MTDLTALEEAASRLKSAFEGGGPFKAELEVYRGISGPSAILSLISTIRDLERERDEARAVIEWADHHYANHDMSHQDFRVEVAQRCADFIEAHASVAAGAGAEDQAFEAAKAEAFKAGMMRAAEIIEQNSITTHGSEAFLKPRDEGDRMGIAYATAIRAEAERGGG